MVFHRLKVLIADDNAEWRRIIATVVQLECDVIGFVERGDEIFPEAVRLRPDVVTIDVSMPGHSGLQALPDLRSALPDALLIVVSTTDTQIYRDEAGRLGADDYVGKTRVQSDLLTAIRKGKQQSYKNQIFA